MCLLFLFHKIKFQLFLLAKRGPALNKLYNINVRVLLGYNKIEIHLRFRYLKFVVDDISLHKYQRSPDTWYQSQEFYWSNNYTYISINRQ